MRCAVVGGCLIVHHVSVMEIREFRNCSACRQGQMSQKQGDSQKGQNPPSSLFFLALPCWLGLKKMYKRDIDRDLKIAKEFKSTLLIPFLDDNVILNAMSISPKRKINKNQNKIILREIAEDLGLRREFAHLTEYSLAFLNCLIV